MSLESLLKNLGLSSKEIAVYNTLLSSGAISVRQIAQNTKINRGTVYDILKSLMKQGLVSYYHEATKQKFIAEDPQKLIDVLENRQEHLYGLHQELDALLPELRSCFLKERTKPVTRFYEHDAGIRTILQDVLDTMTKARKKEYYVYSALDVRRYLYHSFKDFTKRRVSKNILVKVISIGAGWEDELLSQMLAERKWLTKKEGSPTFIIIYGGKTAFISLGKDKNLLGTIVEDDNLYQTQKMIFGQVWKTL